ncbi:helix-turn-helix domain-containing protein [Sphingomonas sp. ACRSK]|jgi:Cu(I)-responsive transcriptional regulator|uniref:MerR family transcriptional regulator n=1 Tax=unclassified Sphingomonas TaxID=196159 RepID=UPI001EF45EA8|nr:helix-turn-helix domain-containing protein [Sphingomonas sp. ACRSK]MCG7350032.1 helix-turn-helix domain-containing protein [Sphingomonas sp. ACRSK]
MVEVLTIGKLAKAAATKVETVRWYEKVGLIDPPVRTDGNYRSYTAHDLSRLTFIRRARDLGFPLDQVRALLDLASEPGRDCGSVDELTSGHLADIDRKIADLAALRRELAALLTSCRGGTMSECRILEAFAPASCKPANR